MRARWISVALLAASVALSGAACDKKREKRAEGAETATKVAEGKEAKPGDQEPRRGGHLKIPSNEPLYLNPVLATRFNRANILLFEGLVGLDAALQPVPRLAESWTVSKDGKVVTFKLRPGVEWHDGEAFTAEDVAFTLESVRSTEAPTLWKGYFSHVDSLETPDDHTVVVRYEKPYAPALVTWTLGIIPAHVFGEGEFTESPANEEPIGTGPYKLTRWENGKRLLLEANEDWWHGRPYIDTVELRVDIENDLGALREGELDFTSIPDIGAWSTEAVLAEFREEYEVATVVGPLFRAIAWNTQKPPLSDRKVRLALTHALDRARVVDDVLLGEGQAISAPFFPNMRVLDQSIAPYPFDLSRAVELLDKAGHQAKNGRRFTLDLVAIDSLKTPPNEEMLAIFRRDLSAIGVELKLEWVSAREFNDRIVLRNFDAAFFGWLPDVPDPDPSPLLHSSQIKGGYNMAGYTDPEVDRILEEAVSRQSLAERRTLYHRLHETLHRDLPYTVLYAPYSHYAWTRRLRAVHPADVGAQPRFPGLARWWLAR